MTTKNIQFIFSALFLVAYMLLIVAILYVEVSDTLNMEQGDNSMMGEVTLLLGVMTGGVNQILNFWFKDSKKEKETEV